MKPAPPLRVMTADGHPDAVAGHLRAPGGVGSKSPMKARFCLDEKSGRNVLTGGRRLADGWRAMRKVRPTKKRNPRQMWALPMPGCRGEDYPDVRIRGAWVICSTKQMAQLRRVRPNHPIQRVMVTIT